MEVALPPARCYPSILLDLPLEIQIMILKQLSADELLQLKEVSSHFFNLIGSVFPHLVTEVSLSNASLNSRTIKILSWLSSHGNIKATIKLGLAYLYHEGSADIAYNRQQNSIKAAEYFCAMEKSSELKSPVAWVFVRPPWSSATVCRKAYVVKHLIKLIEEGQSHPHLLYCVGKVFLLFEDDEQKLHSARDWLQRAANSGLPDATYELWKMDLRGSNRWCTVESIFSSYEPGLRLCLMRRLRRIASNGHKPAQVQLCRLYALGHHEGISFPTAMKFSRLFFEGSLALQSKCSSDTSLFMNSDTRVILVDWLIEVATMKSFSGETLHSTVQCFERYLRLRKVSRIYLQLLGIACMVICSRRLEKDILTIREAVWLTDSSYKYEELVHMMEDVVSALKGNIESITMRDYLSILLKLDDLAPKAKVIAEFIADTCLRYADASTFSPALLASSCVLLANLTIRSENAWSTKMIQFTGHTIDDLARVATDFHNECFSERLPPEDRKFVAIEEKYSQVTFGPILGNEMVSRGRLTGYLHGETSAVHVLVPLKSTIEMTEVRPCSDMVPALHYSSDEEELETDTPPTLPSAYLVRTDTKTRKRIGNGSSPLALRDNASGNAAAQKLLPKTSTATLNRPDMESLGRLNVSKTCDRSLSPRLDSGPSKENLCPERGAKVLKHRAPRRSTSRRSSKSMRSMR